MVAVRQADDAKPFSVETTAAGLRAYFMPDDGGAATGAACTGTFVLAESGLLDGQRATTSWWLAPMFRQRFPRVALDKSRMLVASAGVTTAGAAMAHLDLALAVIRARSPALAALAARYLLVEVRGSQAEFVIPDHLAHTDPVVERFEAVDQIAAQIGYADGVTLRALLRRKLGRGVRELRSRA